jgi:putative CocE/NonD family hydrolase
MTNSIRIDRSVPIEVRDGTVLRADVYRRNDRQKHPVILMRTRYDRLRLEMGGGSAFMRELDTVLSGYAFVVQSVRGTYDSAGKQILDDPYLTVEGPDGYDTVEWIANQPWCDGNVGTAGGSFLGTVQWVLAKENPPHLKAIAPWISGSGMLPTRLNGVFNLGLFVNHLLLDGLELADRLEKQGKDVTHMRALLNHGYDDPEEVYNYLPLKDVPQADYDVLREYWHSVLNPPASPDLKAVRPAYEKISVPCCHVSGWYDFFTSGTFGNFNSMREKGATKLAREGQHVLMGPWNHRGPAMMGDVGELNFGRFTSIIGSPLFQHNLNFFNKYLRGMDVDLPAIRYFLMGKNVWKTADAWPLPNTQWQRYFLHSKGHANTSGGDGLLNRQEPISEIPDVFLYDPISPVPSTGCRGHGTCGFADSPKDQSFIEKRNDILCYTTPELKEDIEVTGPLELHLYASTSAKDTDFTVKLVDVYPDGHAYNVTDGVIRARYRKSFLKEQFIIPNEVNEYVINMETASQMFRKGHCIRLDISSSNFPEYDRNMNTGNPPGQDAKGITAKQQVFHESRYASYIDLPVIGAVAR